MPTCLRGAVFETQCINKVVEVFISLLIKIQNSKHDYIFVECSSKDNWSCCMDDSYIYSSDGVFLLQFWLDDWIQVFKYFIFTASHTQLASQVNVLKL